MHEAIHISTRERAEIRTRAGLAAEAVAPNWPLRAFISRNPLGDYQDERFEEAVRTASSRTGGRGYAALESYRAWYREGRIAKTDLEAALAEQVAHPDAQVRLPDGGELDKREVLRIHLLQALKTPDPLALGCELNSSGHPWRLDPALAPEARAQTLLPNATEAESAQALWEIIRQSQASEDERAAAATPVETEGARLIERDLARIGHGCTLADWCDRLFGSQVRVQMLDYLIHWIAAFLDQGQAVWAMPRRERDLYQTWRSLAHWDFAPAPGAPRGFRARLATLPDDPEDLIIASLRRLGVPRTLWQDYLSCHIARQPGWAGLIRWRASNPSDWWQQRHPASPTKYLAIVLHLEAEAVEAECRRRLGIAGRLDAIRDYFDGRPAEYLARHALGEDWLPPDLERRVRRACRTWWRPGAPTWHRLAEAVRGSRDGLPGGTAARSAWPLFRLAQHLGWNAERLGAWPQDRLQHVLKQLEGWLASLPAEEHGPIWLAALERGYRTGLIEEIGNAYRLDASPVEARVETASGDTAPAQTESTRPLAQALFCIDVRSELFRRALENLGGYETYGVAGFFGVPFSFVGFNSRYRADLCPVLLKPSHRVSELPRPSAERVEQHLAGHHFGDTVEHALHDLKGHVAAPFVMVEAIGWAFGLPFVLKTVIPRWYHRLAAAAKRWITPPVPTALTVDKLSPRDAQELVATQQRGRISHALRKELNLRRRMVVSAQTLEELRLAALSQPADGQRPQTSLAASLELDAAQERALVEKLRTEYGINSKVMDALLDRVTQGGFTDEEQAYFVEGALRLIGLTQGFARVVLVAGHGSHSENNPYESALDCGACGGDHGGSNARVLAHMANKPAVRSLLTARGIEIPSDCWFVACEHDTTTDSVELLDLETVPISHSRDIRQLRADLVEAGARCARERCWHLPGAPNGRDPRAARLHVQLRSVDWSQVRPEWGLAGNAAFIVARRPVFRRLNLGGRAFLHSYDYRTDPEGKALETIMTAPLVVAHWINMEYYFSSADNQVYGSGSKVYHNVVGLIGVMSGNQSDLRIGLPTQTISSRGRLYHEPMRLLAIIEAPLDRVAAIVARNEVLRRIFHNGWGTLAVIDPESGQILLYAGGRWRDPQSTEALPPNAIERPEGDQRRRAVH